MTNWGLKMGDDTLNSNDHLDPKSDQQNHTALVDDENVKDDIIADPDQADSSEKDAPTTSPDVTKTDETPLSTKGSFLPMFVGGIICAGLGFGAAVLTQQQSPLWPKDQAQIEFQAKTENQFIEITKKLVELEARPIPDVKQADLSTIKNELGTIANLEASIRAVATKATEVENRLSALEKSTIEAAIPDELIAQYRAEIKDINEFLETQRAQIQGYMDDAQSKAKAAETFARTATVRGALDKMSVAIDSGLGFSDIMADLEKAIDGPIPDALSSTAEAGVATLQDLSISFATGARVALSTARSEIDQGQGLAKIGNFLKSQFNARSVVPKDGDDPDAVLSRAEALVRDGKISDALDEIYKLSDSAQSEMAEWIANAKARVAAQQAITSLKNDLDQ